jgi:hypothetical protein
MMNTQTALLDVRRMSEADRLTVAGGTSVNELMDNAGKSVAREIQKRWSVRPVIVLWSPVWCGNSSGERKWRLAPKRSAVNSADCGGNLSGCFSAQLRAV